MKVTIATTVQLTNEDDVDVAVTGFCSKYDGEDARREGTDVLVEDFEVRRADNGKDITEEITTRDLERIEEDLAAEYRAKREGEESDAADRANDEARDEVLR